MNSYACDFICEMMNSNCSFIYEMNQLLGKSMNLNSTATFLLYICTRTVRPKFVWFLLLYACIHDHIIVHRYCIFYCPVNHWTVKPRAPGLRAWRWSRKKVPVSPTQLHKQLLFSSKTLHKPASDRAGLSSQFCWTFPSGKIRYPPKKIWWNVAVFFLGK